MSAKKGTSLPISGTSLPHGLQNGLGEVDYTQMVAAALQKHFCRARGATKTVMDGRALPTAPSKTGSLESEDSNSGSFLVFVARHSDDVFAVLLRLTGRQLMLEGDLVEARQKIQSVMAMLDEVMASRERAINGNGAD